MNGLKKVMVFVPFESSVSYEIEVKDSKNLAEIKAKLNEIDPADWYADPNFCESLGVSFSDFVRRVKLADVSEVD